MQKLKSDAEAYLGEKVSVGGHHRSGLLSPTHSVRLLRMPGKIAGLKVERIINEPTAAALAYGLDNEAAAEDHGI